MWLLASIFRDDLTYASKLFPIENYIITVSDNENTNTIHLFIKTLLSLMTGLAFSPCIVLNFTERTKPSELV